MTPLTESELAEVAVAPVWDEECQREFKTEQAYQSHRRWRHEDGCPICEGGFGPACMSHFV